jgi:peptidoglycan/xylan/chitin deacetylase (PgdA/CDA1 family)
MNLLEILRTSDEKIWNQFTKEEEYTPHELDQYGRFSFASSKYRDVLLPAVSDFLLKNGLDVTFPGDQNFGLCLTHDVDYLYFPRGDSLRSSLRCLKNLEVRNAFKWLAAGVNRKSTILRNIPRIIDLETKYDAKSSFFFLAQDDSAVDFIYRIEEFEETLGLITDKGFEVGLHGSLLAYANLELIQQEKNRLEALLGNKVIGYRNHYLRFELPTTWELLNKAGFKYDTTFGYHDAMGFRNGMCHPYLPFDLTKNRFLDIWEIPLGIMDTTFVQYSSLTMAEVWEVIRQIIDVVESRKGIISILWHNSRMFGELLKLYEKILSYCSEKNAWLASGEEIVSWWASNNFLKSE